MDGRSVGEVARRAGMRPSALRYERGGRAGAAAQRLAVLRVAQQAGSPLPSYARCSRGAAAGSQS